MSIDGVSIDPVVSARARAATASIAPATRTFPMSAVMRSATRQVAFPLTLAAASPAVGPALRFGHARAPPSSMSHKHDNLIREIFHDPISTNIQWREIESLLRHLGADIESLSGTRVRVKLNGHEGILQRPHGGNTLGRQDVQHLREYLAHARITPSLYEAGKKA